MALADPDLDLLTIADAAALLRVTPDAVSRFVERGILPAYPGGSDAVRVRRADLDVLFDPAVVETLDPEDIPIPWPRPYVRNPADLDHELIASIKPWTDQERQEAMVALEAARQLREQMRAKRGGKPLPPSWPIIRQAREER